MSEIEERRERASWWAELTVWFWPEGRHNAPLEFINDRCAVYAEPNPYRTGELDPVEVSSRVYVDWRGHRETIRRVEAMRKVRAHSPILSYSDAPR